MNRPIKFRGKRSDNGDLVFGSYCYEDYGKRDARLGVLHAIIDENGEEFIVDEDSIAQFVGYDANGREVYEDDVLIDHKADKEYEARLCGIAHNPFRITDEFFKLNLKEATK